MFILLIFRFAMEVGGQVYLAEVKEKEEALKLYKDAVEEGKSAGVRYFNLLPEVSCFILLFNLEKS